MSGRNNRIVRNRDRSTQGVTVNYKIIIISIIIILGIIIFAILLNSSKNNNTVINGDIDTTISYEYFTLSTETGVGVIDKNGNIILEAIYSGIEIPNPSKGVFIVYLQNNSTEILNENGEQIFTDFENVEAVKSSTDSNQIENFVLKYEENGLYGLIDLDGNKITDAIYSGIASLIDRPGRILVKIDDQYGILDSMGNCIVEAKYDQIAADGYCSGEQLYEKTGYIVAKKTESAIQYGYIDYEGNKLLDTKYESIERALEYEEDDIYLIVMQNGKKGVFKNKKKIIDLNFQDINYSTLSKVFIVNKNSKYGFYNLNGKAILDAQYTSYAIAGNYISVTKNDETNLYDINGNLVGTSSYTKMIETDNPSYFIAVDENGYYSIISKNIEISENYIQVTYAFGEYFIFTNEDGKAGVINASTKEVEIEPNYDFIILIEDTNSLQAIDGINNFVDIYSSNLEKTITMEDGIVESFDNGYSIVYSETDMKYINSNGEVVSNTEAYPDKKLYAIEQDGKWGFMDTSGNIAVTCEYDIVTELNEYGFAGIKKDGKWGVIDEEGNIIVEPTYELDTYYFPEFIGKYLLVQSESTYCEEIVPIEED